MASKKLNFFYIASIITAAGTYGLIKYRHGKDVSAQNAIYNAIYLLKEEKFQLALDGNEDVSAGFINIINDYPCTDTANLANLYAGICYLNIGDFQKSLTYLEKFKTKEPIMKMKTLALQGDVLVELKQYDKAIGTFVMASQMINDDEYSSIYLYKAALACQANNDETNAVKYLQDILKKFPKSSICHDIVGEIERLTNNH